MFCVICNCIMYHWLFLFYRTHTRAVDGCRLLSTGGFENLWGRPMFSSGGPLVDDDDDDDDTQNGVRCDDEVTLTTATLRESTSAKPTTLFRRINVERIVPGFSPTLELFELGSTEGRRSQTNVWNWDYYCQLQPKQGNCSKSLIRYYYDAQLDQCLTFTFAGCDANKNNFNSLEDCERYCKGAAYMPLNETEISNACFLQPHSGLCLAYFTRYYYDVNEGTCKTFVYGGCGGNGNRFDTLMKCLDECGNDDTDK